MDYNVIQDIETILELRDLSVADLAKELEISRITLNNWIDGKTAISHSNVERLYKYAFDSGIRLNKIKEQFYREESKPRSEHILFHGSKNGINGHIKLSVGEKYSDFGSGFYCGESLEQSVMFVSSYPNSSLYILRFNHSGLKKKEYSVSREWMIMIAYFRGIIDSKNKIEIIEKELKQLESVDYIVAPIADNRMFEIIDQFIAGEITDVQCKHCLSATNLGMQYVFRTKKALNKIEILERCFLTEVEKRMYLKERHDNYEMNRDKVKLARRNYRNKGKYIEEILK